MNKYIKLQDAIKSVADQYMFEASIENPQSCDDIKEWEKVASKVFSDIPTIDIVRCKDCFHYTQRTEHTGICDFWNAGVAFKDFCSMANQEPMLERIEE